MLQAAADVGDWPLFLALCGHHRLAPLVYRSLSRALAAEAGAVPADVMSALRHAATRNAHSTLSYLTETRRLCAMLQDAGISVRVLKGVPLSQLIYDDPSLRDVGDIDLLIPAGTEEAADRLLLAEGFRRSEPAATLTPRRRRSWRMHGKDYTYDDERCGFEVDLHWRLFRNRHMPGNGLSEPAAAASERIVLGDCAFDVLPVDRNFLFLCVSGALDGWFRFKSLVDVAWLWSRFSNEQRETVLALARQHRVLPEMAAALQLASRLDLLDAGAIPPALHLAATAREARWILNYASAQHGAQHYQPTPQAAGSWALKRYELGLRGGAAYRWAVVQRVLLRPRMWQRFDLPDALFPLYALLSPLEWMMWQRAAARPAGPRAQGRWRRFMQMPLQRKWLLAEAFLLLFAARAALRVLPVRAIFRWAAEASSVTPSVTDHDHSAEAVRWAVLTVARYGPLSFVCFPQALAGSAMLRWRRIGSTLHYGVRRSADGQLRAHTWLQVGERMLLGGESAPLFTRVDVAKSGAADV